MWEKLMLLKKYKPPKSTHEKIEKRMIYKN